MIISVLSIIILILWEQKFIKRFKITQVIQGPLVVVVLGILLNLLFMGQGSVALNPGQVVSIPVAGSLGEFFGLFTTPDFSQLLNKDIYIIAFTIAIVASLETLLQLDFIRVIPGHGDTTDRNGMRQFLALIAQLAEIARTAAEKGDSLEQTLQTDQLTADEGYEQLGMIIPLPMDREFVITRAWEETTENFKRLN